MSSAPAAGWPQTRVAAFFAVLVRSEQREQIRLGLMLWVAMVGGALALAYLMAPFPN